MSRLVAAVDTIPLSFPRVSGDEPPASVDQGVFQMFSPRERG